MAERASFIKKPEALFSLALLASVISNINDLYNSSVNIEVLCSLVVSLSSYMVIRRYNAIYILTVVITLAVLHEYTGHALDSWWGYEVVDETGPISTRIHLLASGATIGLQIVLSIVSIGITRIIAKKIIDHSRPLKAVHLRPSPLETIPLITGLALVAVILPLGFYKEDHSLDLPFFAIAAIVALISVVLGIISFKRERGQLFLNHLGLFINSYVIVLGIFLRTLQ